jgi:hypothetical protein
MNIIRKGQIERVGKGDIRGQVKFVEGLFRASNEKSSPALADSLTLSPPIFATQPLMVVQVLECGCLRCRC